MQSGTEHVLEGVSEMPRNAPTRQETLRRLLDVGHAVVERKGYYEASIDDIVTEAGLSRATFYLYFEAKADLLRALVIDSIDVSTAMVPTPPLAAEAGDLESEVRDWLRSIVDISDRYARLWDAWARESARDPSLSLLFSMRARRRHDAAVAALAGSPAAFGSDLDLLATLLDTFAISFSNLQVNDRGDQHDLANLARFVTRGFYGR
jgi:AcrR family transcriptional regulator